MEIDTVRNEVSGFEGINSAVHELSLFGDPTNDYGWQ